MKVTGKDRILGMISNIGLANESAYNQAIAITNRNVGEATKIVAILAARKVIGKNNKDIAELRQVLGKVDQ